MRIPLSAQIEVLVNFLAEHPGGTTNYGIGHHLETVFGGEFSAGRVARLLRKARDSGHLVVTLYDHPGQIFLYRFPHSLVEVEYYSRDRALPIRGSLTNIISMIDLGQDMFADEDRTAILSVRAHLVSALALVEPLVVAS